MDILDDMGVSTLSAKGFLKSELLLYCILAKFSLLLSSVHLFLLSCGPWVL